MTEAPERTATLHFVAIDDHDNMLDYTMCGGHWQEREETARQYKTAARRRFVKCEQCIANWRHAGGWMYQDYRRVVGRDWQDEWKRR